MDPGCARVSDGRESIQAHWDVPREINPGTLGCPQSLQCHIPPSLPSILAHPGAGISPPLSLNAGGICFIPVPGKFGLGAPLSHAFSDREESLWISSSWGSGMQDGQRGTPQNPPLVQQIKADLFLLLHYKTNPKIHI